MINRVVLVGRLTKDPDLRYTQSGAAVATFTVAVDRQFTNQNGERGADFINCVIWRKAAENFANFTHKGSMIAVEGRLQSRSYENQQGNRVYVTEVVVDNFSLLETKAQSEQYRREHPNQGGSSMNNNSSFDSNPYGNPAGNQGGAFNGNVQTGNLSNPDNSQDNANNADDPFADNGQQIDISDDDLPF
ncbi:MAG TPA: single-stranded DNA-binding protein [Candidatus Ligilactobacillus excrementigallinarum]|uniref:Single-stranded DNA-binding protein n=1 Tax=Candidatus Ligilactobacillus excrementigallinarum TaxID=2838641 RepID=A0A9D1UWZ1_9LACO|nr:single-stranded DNA-binding protein [Candidatus Ligilactobacillus excrementigallinarum]